jgi:hypothetical protein
MQAVSQLRVAVVRSEKLGTVWELRGGGMLTIGSLYQAAQ